MKLTANKAVNADKFKRRFALLEFAGYSRRQASHSPPQRQRTVPSGNGLWQATEQTSGVPMGIPVEVLEAELLKLPKADRIRVLDRVVASLDADVEREAAWDAVAAQRDAEADRDPSVLLALDDVLTRLRAEVQ